MYRCDDCGNRIEATRDDPVHRPGTKTLCATCVGKPAAAVAAPKASRRGEAARARWAAMPPEERAASVAKMRAGRVAATTDGQP